MHVTADQHKHHHQSRISQSAFVLCGKSLKPYSRDSRANISTVVYHACIVRSKGTGQHETCKTCPLLKIYCFCKSMMHIMFPSNAGGMSLLE